MNNILSTFTARVHSQTRAYPPPPPPHTHTYTVNSTRDFSISSIHTVVRKLKRVMHVERWLWTDVLTIMGFWSHDHLHSPPRHIPVMLLETLPVVYPVDVVGIDSDHN